MTREVLSFDLGRFSSSFSLESFVDAAVSDIQNNKCADAVNALGIKDGFTVQST
jgi:hypothetical protein